MRLKAREDLVLRKIDDKFFIIDLYNKDYAYKENIISMNISSYYIFKYIQEEKVVDFQDIEDFVYENFQIPETYSKETIRKDINKFIHKFKKLGYILLDEARVGETLNSDDYGLKQEGTLNKASFDWEEWNISLGDRGIPLHGGIELTSFCNMNCLHCYQQDIERKPNLSTNDIKQILDQLAEASVLFIYFTGGEIFTRLDFTEIYIYAKRKGFIISLLSNATIIPDTMFNVFEKYPPQIFSTSVYGTSSLVYDKVPQTRGNVDKFMKNCNRIKELGINLELKFIVLKQNMHQFEDFISLCEDFGLDMRYSAELFPTLTGDRCVYNYRITNEEIVDLAKYNKDLTRTLHHVTKLENKYSKQKSPPLFMCDICTTGYLIDDRGFLNPSSRYRLEKYNLKKQTFSSAWSDIQNIKFIKAQKGYKCVECKYLPICNPCTAQNILETGNIDQPGKIRCDLAKRKFEEFSKDSYAENNERR